jgi:tight adherence protein B
MLLPILSIVVFAVTMGLALSFLYFFVDAPLNRRKMMTRLAAIQEIQARNDDVPDILRRELLSDLPILNRILATVPGIPNLRLFLEQGAVRMQVGTFVLCVAALPMFTLVLTLAIGRPAYQCAVAALLSAAVPFAVTSVMRGRRFNKFEEQFPEAMDLLGRAVRAGHAFTTGFELIGKELPDPVGEEFRLAFQQQNLGVPLRDALQNMSARVPLPDVRIFVSSLQIQRESGGNLGEILDMLSYVIRERFKLRRQVRIFTAEGRMSSYMLTAIPFVALGGMAILQPDYLRPLFTDARGQMALTVAAVLQVIGYVVINKIIKIKM